MKSKALVGAALAAVMAVGCIPAGCGGPLEQRPAEHEHDWGEWTQTVAPTCETKGEEKRVCKSDPSHVETRAVSAPGHDWSEAWTFGEDTHFHICRRGCGAKSGEEAHRIKNGACEICGYSLVPSRLRYEAIEEAGVVMGYRIAGFDEGETDRTRLVAEASHEGSPVVEVGESAFENETELKTVYLPDTVKTVGYSAFFGCDQLSQVDFPSVENVASEAFGHCTALKRAAFGKVATWGETDEDARQNCLFIFDGSEALQSVSVAEGSRGISSEGGVLYNEGKTEVVYAPPKLAGVVRLPSTVVTVGNFSGCTEITEIVLPEGVQTIEGLAFFGCVKLQKINIPNSVTMIGGDDPFEGCESLQTETEGGIRYLDGWALGAAEEVAELRFRDGTRGIVPNAFAEYGAEKIFVPESVICIGWGAFSQCTGLKEITLPYLGITRETAGAAAFEMIFGYFALFFPMNGEFAPQTLKKVTVTERVALPEKCFYKCKYIEEIEFTGGVSAIGKQALAEMTALGKIVFSGQITDWLAVGKGEKWADNSDFTVQCTNGSVSSADEVL